MVLHTPHANGSWGRPLWTEIDLDALTYNVACLKRQAGPASVAAGVKANAYGHGAVAVGRGAREAEAAGVRQPLHLKVDTGLNRYGVTPQEVVPLAETLRAMPSLEVEGVFTHFASADEGDKRFTLEPYTTFRGVAEKLPWIPLRLVSTTATLPARPQ